MAPTTFLDLMHDYFKGERAEALLFIAPLGVASLIASAYLFLGARDVFSRGVGVPCLVLGLLLTGVGGSVALRTASQVSTFEARYQANATSAVKEELARMRKVNAAWPTYLAFWVGFAVAGIALRFGLRSDFAQGLGVALVFFGGAGMIIDGFAERRARPYTAALEAQAQEAR